MIESFTITNHLGESLVLELASPETSGLLVDSVTGLGQVTAKSNITQIAGSDYSTQSQAFLGKRNIVFKFIFIDDDSETAQHLLDKMFPTKKTIKIVCKTTQRELWTEGMVEKNDPTIFGTPQVGCTVSILCPDPFWYSLDITPVPFSGITPAFEFPFCSDIESDDTMHTIEFGDIRIIKDKSIYYTGESEVGITIEINALNIVRDLTFYNVDKREKISIDDTILAQITGGESIQQGDYIVISTIKHKKYATLLRNGVKYNIINALGKNRDWFELTRGDNLFSYSASEGEYDCIINIKYRKSYKGI